MVRELKTGLLLILAWVTGSLAIKVWPQVNLAELALLDRIGWVFFFHPFHYLTAILLLLFFILMAVVLWRRVVYEWQLVVIIGQRPLKVMIATILLLGIHLRLIAFFGWAAVVVTVIIGIYEIIYQLLRRKKGLIVLKKW